MLLVHAFKYQVWTKFDSSKMKITSNEANSIFTHTHTHNTKDLSNWANLANRSYILKFRKVLDNCHIRYAIFNFAIFTLDSKSYSNSENL